VIDDASDDVIDDVRGDLTDPTADPTTDPGCAVAHGQAPDPQSGERELVAVYGTEVASYLLAWGRELGFRTVLVEPDRERVTLAHQAAADLIVEAPDELTIAPHTDVVVTDHHRDDLGHVMAPLVTAGPRWIGIMGSPRHAGPHGPALRDEGVAENLIATVHRPIGLDIGSTSPAEIALSTLAGLLAHRAGRAGGFPAPSAASDRPATLRHR
jgi:xanthine dehydrogenase accessory factor